jgi:heptaprenyl diphosphate synthase
VTFSGGAPGFRTVKGVAAPNPLLDLPGMAELRQRIERQLLDTVETRDPRLTEMTSHLILAGGKRLRPVLCALASVTRSAAGATSGPLTMASVGDHAVTGGVAIELVHVGSLHHDDVIDESATRHNVESVNARWGNFRAIISGDYLLAKASELGTTLGTDVAQLLARTIAELCEGEVRELYFAYQVDRSESDYNLAIEGKTARLYASACRIGGMVVGAPADHVEALGEFGLAYGMAFQVVDDVLDVVSTDEELGKPAGHDMVEGVYNLPVLRALQGPSGRSLREVLGGELDDDARLRALKLVRESDGVRQAVTVAQEYVDQGVAALGRIPVGAATAALAAAAQHLVDGVRERV